MPSERSRPATPHPTESSAEQVRERTYDEKEVAAILRRATRLEGARGTSTGALTLRELEAIARDAGIEVALVRQAARELDGGPAGSLGVALAGAPVRRTIERVAEGEIGSEDHERLAEEAREVLSTVGARWILPGGVSSIGRSLTLSGFTGTTSVEVTAVPRAGHTFIRITTDRSQLAGGLFGGIIGGVGGGLGSNVGWMLPAFLHVPAAFGVAAAAAVVLGAYGLARSIFARSAKRLDPRLDALADRLEAIAQDAASRRSAPPVGP
ncbi:MAG: hypothetical protein EHM78_24700 [Myxococcaceae bacterium]|nr:MAG: hypothetical protein EHM78_24700 [Myxococcaceae bacterium]